MLAYFRGQVSQHDAAKLLEMRKETFAEFAAGWAADHVESAVAALPPEDLARVRDGVAWRDYMRRFLATFPECDERCVRRDSLPILRTDDLWRPCGLAPVTTYDADQAAALLPAQSGTGIGIAWENGYWSIAPRDPRALPRDTGQHPFDQEAA